ncbi:hypothetical protein Bca4012_051721 [Brassica carinata]|uniref:Uncharacterized protein n=1 Tax=Brassica carinata TaxID=52824 RepID=A0A8X7R735_BRACI|nr:hypothetical protein Bca52824_054266 [Brassica carinata]
MWSRSITDELGAHGLTGLRLRRGPVAIGRTHTRTRQSIRTVGSNGLIGCKAIRFGLRPYLVVWIQALDRIRLEKANQEDLGRSQKSKEAAGQSSQVAADGTNPTGLPTDPVVANTGGELPTDPTNPTGTHQGNEEGQQHQEREEEVESSNANRDGDQQEVAADSTAKQAAALSMKDMLEAMKVMGNQVVAMTQLFTLLVNSSVGQATLVATATPVADGPAVETAEVVEIDPPRRRWTATVTKMERLRGLRKKRRKKKKKERRQRKKKKSQDEASLAPSRANIEEDEGGEVVRVSLATRGWAITGGMLRVVHGLVRVVLCEDIHI